MPNKGISPTWRVRPHFGPSCPLLYIWRCVLCAQDPLGCWATYLPCGHVSGQLVLLCMGVASCHVTGQAEGPCQKLWHCGNVPVCWWRLQHWRPGSRVAPKGQSQGPPQQVLERLRVNGMKEISPKHKIKVLYNAGSNFCQLQISRQTSASEFTYIDAKSDVCLCPEMTIINAFTSMTPIFKPYSTIYNLNMLLEFYMFTCMSSHTFLPIQKCTLPIQMMVNKSVDMLLLPYADNGYPDINNCSWFEKQNDNNMCIQYSNIYYTWNMPN